MPRRHAKRRLNRVLTHPEDVIFQHHPRVNAYTVVHCRNMIWGLGRWDYDGEYTRLHLTVGDPGRDLFILRSVSR